MSEAREILPEEEQEAYEAIPKVPMLDDMDAEYMLKQIREANEQYDKLKSWYSFNLEKAKEVRDKTIAWAESNLRSYMDSVPAKVAKTQKSYDLPSGKLVLKQQEPAYEQDDKELVPWLKKNGMTELVKVKESSNWEELKKKLKISPDGLSMVTEDGEIVPGVKVTPRNDKFTVKLK